MKGWMTAACALAAGMLLADGAADTNALAKAERRRQRREQRVAQEGGLVEKAAKGGKTIMFTNMQRRVEPAVVETAAQTLAGVVNMPVQTAAGVPAKGALAEAETAAKRGGFGAVVLLVEEKGLPAVLVAPERSWAVVNVTALAEDFPPSEVLAVRVRKELVRAAAWALGAGESMMKPCLMQYAPTVADLDANRTMVPSPDPMMRMVNGGMARGLQTVRRATYRQACKEGWAPAPTNDVQRAIWEKVQAEKERGPSNPLTIAPPKK